MRYADGGLKRIDSANGPGVRVSLFVQGCRKHCRGCFNQETWDFCGGHPYGKEEEDMLIGWGAPEYISGITFLGGDPTEPENAGAVLHTAERFREAYPEKSIWIYSGDTLEMLKKRFAGEPELRELLSVCDILVDGPFVAEKKNLSLRFRGSENQRIIDLKKTAENGWNAAVSDAWPDRK